MKALAVQEVYFEVREPVLEGGVGEEGADVLAEGLVVSFSREPSFFKALELGRDAASPAVMPLVADDEGVGVT